MKKICTLLLTAGMLMGAATGASAIDFKASGQWIFEYGVSDQNFTGRGDSSDSFGAQQRVRLQIDAVASEALSGTVFFEIGNQTWGKSGDDNRMGAALGTDGFAVEVRRAYIDWYVPNSELSFRMGLQGVALPSAAGGSQIFDTDVAGIVANYKFNEMVSLTAAWLRPFNDNFGGDTTGPDRASENYLDNTDLFLLSLPVTGANWSVNPWVMVGMVGDHTFENAGNAITATSGLFPVTGAHMDAQNGYSTVWFAGLPMTYQMDAWNFELDINYGSMSYTGDGATANEDTKRAGWLVKGLVEYKMDWGTPGLYAWYGSGDDGNTSNGSEMMPFIAPTTYLTSYLGENTATTFGGGVGLSYSFAGSWGVGARISDMSFMEDLTHTLSVTYRRGTNSADGDILTAVKNQSSNVLSNQSYYSSANANAGFYLTSKDYLVEITLENNYQIYENLSAHVELGYIINGMDEDAWQVDNRDGYKANLILNYSF